MAPALRVTFVANCLVTVIDEKNAEAVSYVQQYFHDWDEIKDGTVPSLQPYTLCRHDNKMVLTDEGWKIKHRDVSELIPPGIDWAGRFVRRHSSKIIPGRLITAP